MGLGKVAVAASLVVLVSASCAREKGPDVAPSAGSTSNPQAPSSYANARWSTVKMQAPRGWPTATPLANGTVLIVGGCSGVSSDGNCSSVNSSAEIYDPAKGATRPTTSMSTPRASHTAIGLLDGRVLVLGGFVTANGNHEPLASAELYDPTTERWVPAVPLSQPAQAPVAVRLADGAVLVVGTSMRIFDPTVVHPATNEHGAWHPVPAPVGIGVESMVLLGDGRVLAVGADIRAESMEATRKNNPEFPWAVPRAAQIYVPEKGVAPATGKGSWTEASPPSGLGFLGGTVTVAGDGRAIAVGGLDLTGGSSATRIFDPAPGTWSSADDLHDGRSHHGATRVATGDVLVAGGRGLRGRLTSAEVYRTGTGRWAQLPPLSVGREHPAVASVDDRSVLVAGGFGTYVLEELDVLTF